MVAERQVEGLLSTWIAETLCPSDYLAFHTILAQRSAALLEFFLDFSYLDRRSVNLAIASSFLRI